MQLKKHFVQVTTIFLSLIDLVLGDSVPVSPIERPPTPPTVLNYANSPSPKYYCFDQGDLNGELNATTIKYRLIIAPEHVNKYGNIFVGFNRKSDPGKLWLLGFSEQWKLYNPVEMPQFYPRFTLAPIVDLNILPKPTDLMPFNRDGLFWVGYGLKSTDDASEAEAFQEMLSAKRYKQIWEVGDQSYLYGGDVCVNITWFGVTSAGPLL